MPLGAVEVEQLAAFLDEGLVTARECAKLTERHPDLSIDDAYRVMHAGIGRREGRGEKVVGYKMGLTSKAKRDQMGLHSPIYGVLTDRMVVRDGRFGLAGAIHPKIEPEIAFLTRAPLSGVVTAEEVLEATEAVAAAMEILDSRYVGFKYFSLPDVVADNASSSHLVVGPWRHDFRGLDLAGLDMAMSVDGAVAERAPSSAISGDPVQSVVQLCALLAGHGLALPAGSLVLAGAATTAVALKPGLQVTLAVTGLADVSVEVSA
jgi:2-oxo-3-hexenedioate decarboxylase